MLQGFAGFLQSSNRALCAFFILKNAQAENRRNAHISGFVCQFFVHFVPMCVLFDFFSSLNTYACVRVCVCVYVCVYKLTSKKDAQNEQVCI